MLNRNLNNDMSAYVDTRLKCMLPVNECKKLQFKAVCNGDTAYVTQIKQQTSKRCYYFGSTLPYSQHIPK